MKCLVLAGGRGERLWPLSRKNLPKQFIKVQKNHSIFQETIARNIPYCDEFIIITNYDYRYIIENQMDAFHGVYYRCVYEEEPRKTTAAITLACLGLQPSEYVFVAAADHLVDTATESEGERLSYKDAIVYAKQLASDNKIVLFGKRVKNIKNRFGYVADGRFYEKPDRVTSKIIKEKKLYQNLGMFLFQNGFFQNELKRYQSDVFEQIRTAYNRRIIIPEGMFYNKDILETIVPTAIEKALVEKTENLVCIEAAFSWNDIGQLEDLEKTGFIADGVSVVNEGSNSIILNQSNHQVVVVNDLDNVLVVNTTDAVYVGRRGKSNYLKEILHDYEEVRWFSDRGITTYRSWGYYETIVEEQRYRLRRVIILPGRTIYEHKHEERKEIWTILDGNALITLEGEGKRYAAGETEIAIEDMTHQISNIGESNLLILETAVGDVLQSNDVKSDQGRTITETELGLSIDPIIKLSPAFKDYLWGGTKLRDVYGKQCDFEVIAESWELSAHPDGNSIVASGRHKGLAFSRYLETVGKSVLGWKCMQEFPLLIKLIDAKQNLSVQVHPNDDYALANENEYGKNEMWYVIDSEKGAGLYVGFNRDVTRKEVKQRVTDNTILDILNFIPVHPGDVFFIPAGTVHAIGAGNLICEIQQSSNSTYRLYDYDRRDKFGNPRELHLWKALDVLNYQKYETGQFTVEDESGQKIIRCKYFETAIFRGEKEIKLTDDSFSSIICIKGKGKLKLKGVSMDIQAGDSLFMPAVNDMLKIAGELFLVLTRI